MDGRKRKHCWNKFTKQKSVEAGISGLFITIEGQESRALAEAYNLIEELLIENEPETETSPKSDDEDIADAIKRACTESKTGKSGERRYYQRPTGVKNSLFVAVKKTDVCKLSEKMVVMAQSSPRCRYLQRVLPVEETADFHLNNLEKMITNCVARHLISKEGTLSPSYALEFKTRNNDSLSKGQVLEILNTAVLAVAPMAKVDLKNPDITIFVQLVRKTLMIGAVRDFYGKRKYNMRPLPENKNNT